MGVVICFVKGLHECLNFYIVTALTNVQFYNSDYPVTLSLYTCLALPVYMIVPSIFTLCSDVLISIIAINLHMYMSITLWLIIFVYLH